MTDTGIIRQLNLLERLKRHAETMALDIDDKREKVIALEASIATLNSELFSIRRMISEYDPPD